MPGSAFDASGPPDGDYARYLERISAGGATGSADPTRKQAQVGTPAEHRWGHASVDDGDEDLATGLDACPGPAPGFGLDQAGTLASGGRARDGRSGRASHDASPAGAASPPSRRILDVLALVLILAGIAGIALAALPAEPWFSTPLPGFVLLVAGLHLRSRSRRRRRNRHGQSTRT